MPLCAPLSVKLFSMATAMRERIIDGALISVAVLALVLLVAVAKMVVVHILCGLFFMLVAAYTVSRARLRCWPPVATPCHASHD